MLGWFYVMKGESDISPEIELLCFSFFLRFLPLLDEAEESISKESNPFLSTGAPVLIYMSIYFTCVCDLTGAF